MNKLLVDGVCFQNGSNAHARLWHSLLKVFACNSMVELFILDRGGVPEIANVRRIPFPYYHERYTSDDSILLQRVCDCFSIDVFISTWCTTPLSTPMILALFQPIVNIRSHQENSRFWLETQLTFAFARHFVVFEECTKMSLLEMSPYVSDSEITVVRPDVYEPNSKKIRSIIKIDKQNERSYLLIDCTRVNSYKETIFDVELLSLIRGIREKLAPNLNMICIVPKEIIQIMAAIEEKPRLEIIRSDLKDNEFVTLIAGAFAIVKTEIGEGISYGLVEAMNAGCPVITLSTRETRKISADSAVTLINSLTATDVIDSIDILKSDKIRHSLIDLGQKRAKYYTYGIMVDAILDSAQFVKSESQEGKYDSFFVEWSKLRMMQANVDTQRLF